MLERGQGPIVMEPVTAQITLRRPGTPKVFALDHDGRLTPTAIPVRNGVFTIDGARDKTRITSCAIKVRAKEKTCSSLPRAGLFFCAGAQSGKRRLHQ
jgi:hypothetical protein